MHFKLQFSHTVVSKFCDPMDCRISGFPVHHQLPELAQTHVHWVCDAVQPSHPLSSPFPQPSIFPSIRVFSNESVFHIRWPKYWSFSFSINPSNEHLGLISFRIDWSDTAVQGTVKSLLQNHSLKVSVLHCSAFIIVQFSPFIHDYWKNHSISALPSFRSKPPSWEPQCPPPRSLQWLTNCDP